MKWWIVQRCPQSKGFVRDVLEMEEGVSHLICGADTGCFRSRIPVLPL